MIDLSQVPAMLVTVTIHVGAAILIFLVGRWLAGRLRNWASRGLQRTAMTPSLSELICRLVYYGFLLLTLIAVLAVLGIPIAAILSVSAIAIVVIGIALRESIADLAAAVIFLMMQPFRAGEVVEANGMTGTIKEISLFSTVMVSADGRILTLPNSKIQQANLVNYTRAGTLGADVVVTIRHDSNMVRAKEIMKELAAADARVLPEPAVAVTIRTLGENGVELQVRPFVHWADYWATRADLTERVKIRFDEEGIALAAPRRDVRVMSHEASS